jgi:predicted component of type VI protein secretion system
MNNIVSADTLRYLNVFYENMESVRVSNRLSKDEFAKKIGASSRQNYDNRATQHTLWVSFAINTAIEFGVDIGSLFEERLKVSEMKAESPLLMKNQIDYLQEMILMRDKIIDMKDDLINRLEIDKQELKNKLSDTQLSYDLLTKANEPTATKSYTKSK